MSKFRGVLVGLLLLVAEPALAQMPQADPDHGPVLSTAMEVAPGKLKDTTDLAATKNYVFRGRVISLGKERDVHLCFDTEMMRVAGAWTGPYPGYTADKNMGPAVTGPLIFTTKPGPGWAKEGKWDDPRVGKEGPLPRDWGHYKGMYLHGDKVVLSYSVGNCDVLELPGYVKDGGTILVTRTLSFSAMDKPLKMTICELDCAKNTIITDTQTLRGERATHTVRVPLIGGKKLHRKIWAWTKDAPANRGLEGEANEDRLILSIPTMPQGGTVVIANASYPVDDKMGDDFPEALRQLDDLPGFHNGGPRRWKDTLETQGVIAPISKDAYVVDEITAPEKNPWHMPMRFGGLDFFPDGRAALCTWDGDVWIVSGLDDTLKKVRWQRFAAGLHQPLGLKIVDGIIHVAGRDQITRLHDLNGDGEADYYENFNNDAGLTLQRHEFVMDLQTDTAGNFYYCRSGHYLQSKRGDNGCIYKLSPDGKKLEKLARGLREPNGLSIAPDGTMTTSDNEGNGIPQTPIYHLKPGAFYGFTAPTMPETHGKHNGFKQTEPALVWLPKNVDTSAGTQIPVTSERWGPLKGGLLHTSYGNSALFALLTDRTVEPWQGAVARLPLRFSSGIMRGRFSPTDGQLYLCGLRGWGTNAAREGTFCRVRYTGQPTRLPTGIAVVKNGLVLTFAEPLDKAAAEDDGNWGGDWSDLFGGAGRQGKTKQEIPIDKTTLSPDGRTVTVALEALLPVSNYRLQYRLKGADGVAFTGEIHGTINRIPR